MNPDPSATDPNADKIATINKLALALKGAATMLEEAKTTDAIKNASTIIMKNWGPDSENKKELDSLLTAQSVAVAKRSLGTRLKGVFIRGGEKKGGALVDLDKTGAAIYNASDLVGNDRPWDSIVKDPIVSALGFMPAPFNSGVASSTNYMYGLPTSVSTSLMPQVGGKKKAAKPAKSGKDSKSKRK